METTERTTDMTAADWISDRRALLDAATEGPWEAEPLEGNIVTPAHGNIIEVFRWTDADAELIADARTSLPKAVNALESVLELANGWTARGEHLMTYSKTIPEEIGTSLLEAGADFVERARILRNTLTTALGV